MQGATAVALPEGAVQTQPIIMMGTNPVPNGTTVATVAESVAAVAQANTQAISIPQQPPQQQQASSLNDTSVSLWR